MNKVFETPEPVQLFVEVGRGRVRMNAREVSESTVEITGDQSDEVAVEQRGRSSPSSLPRTVGASAGIQQST